MSDKSITVKEALAVTIKEMQALTADELRAELNLHRNGCIAAALRDASLRLSAYQEPK
ncbi:hypothetical protein [Glaciimonas immobilis]|uniref:Uncharacterized protein n=1 Tax=Glaciimonas immobilis TaxID=728004 RepID=A0A840RUP7_9BURK|nr:hypothetical protein [Glaciimonas immobilis]KAF3997528.1 hypothetical protein HAV38_12680 [Glaciimonas immobilis]MBB5200788.1 hypothetical protein [Glaciimonas immobilis]